MGEKFVNQISEKARDLYFHILKLLMVIWQLKSNFDLFKNIKSG